MRRVKWLRSLHRAPYLHKHPGAELMRRRRPESLLRTAAGFVFQADDESQRTKVLIDSPSAKPNPKLPAGENAAGGESEKSARAFDKYISGQQTID